MCRLHVVCALLLSLHVHVASAAESLERGFIVKRRQSQECVALVVGNAAYPDQPLRNPVHDATDVAQALEGVGFTVTRVVDADRMRFQKAVEEFGRQIIGRQAACFYYAGHGLQVNGENYLLPVGEELNSEAEVPYKTVNAGLIMAQMEAARCPVNLVVLDACRNNPLARSGRSSIRGLAQVQGPAGSLIVYSTAPGQIAGDGDGRNGVFTAAFLRHLGTPGLDIDVFLRQVSGDVQQVSSGRQVPWRSSNLTQGFCFVPATADASGAIASPAATRPAMQPREPGQAAISKPPADEGQAPLGKPSWARDLRKDQIGTYAKLLVGPHEQTMRWIEPGTFIMGSPQAERDAVVRAGGTAEWVASEIPHQVTISRGLWMADSECTQAIWQEVMRSNPSKFTGDDLRPVEQVNWHEVQGFLRELNRRINGGAFRLPTEAEWEYACRAGTKTAYSFGAAISARSANFDGGYPFGGAARGEYRRQTVRVKSMPANAWGLYEMHGNVWEWCSDWYAPYSGQEERDPTGPAAGTLRIYRGGGWDDFGWYCRAAYRSRMAPGDRVINLGFRFVAP